MPDRTVIIERAHAVNTIVLSRPTALNALSLELAGELNAAVRDAIEDRGVRCIVLTATGRAFCAGGDVKQFAAALPRADLMVERVAGLMHDTIAQLVRAGKPVVTAVNGVTAGGGLGLALSGDLVIAAESATFSMAYSRIAAAPDNGSTYFLARLIGARRAFELYATNRVLTAREALDRGMVTRVVPDDELRDATAALAAELAAGPTKAYAAAKRLLHDSLARDLEGQLAAEARAITESAGTKDFANGIAAFVEKRAPTFSGE